MAESKPQPNGRNGSSHAVEWRRVTRSLQIRARPAVSARCDDDACRPVPWCLGPILGPDFGFNCFLLCHDKVAAGVGPQEPSCDFQWARFTSVAIAVDKQ
jgi:hypothetical protein